MPEIGTKRPAKDLEVVRNGEQIASFNPRSGELFVASAFLDIDEARAFVTHVAGFLGGTVTWGCSETPDSAEESGGNGTAAKPEGWDELVQVALGAYRIADSGSYVESIARDALKKAGVSP